MDTLGEEYSEKMLTAALSGEHTHIPTKTRRMKQRISLLIDIQAKVQEGKGAGYENWAKKFNLKQLASSMAFISTHGIKTYEELSSRVDESVRKTDDLLARVQSAESRLKEIGETKKAITNYLKTKDIYAEWKRSGYSKAFYAQHEEQIIIHKAAKKAFDGIQGKIPTIKALSAEYAAVLSEKQKVYAQYREARSNMRELLTVKANIDTVTERPARDREIVR